MTVQEEFSYFSISREPTDMFQIHYHPFYEVYYFISGDADYLVEGKEYHLTPHSLILLSPHVFHGVRINSTADYIRSAIHFSPEVLSTERRTLLLSSFPGNQKKALREAFYENTKEFGLYHNFNQLMMLQEHPEKNAIYYSSFLEALLAGISLMSEEVHPTAAVNTVSETITDMIHYLNDNLTQSISLDLLANRFFISKYYMNRAFKRATGTTVMDYLIYKRIVMAKQLIINGHTAADAAVLSGFGDYSAFYKAYKKIMGNSPGMDKSSGAISIIKPNIL